MTTPGGRSEPRQYAPDFLTELFRNPLDPGYADAAARRSRTGTPTGWPRRVTTAVTAATLVALGFLLVVAYRQTVADEPARTQARNALIEQVQKRRAGTDRLQARADALRAEVAALRERELGGPAVARLRDLEAATGLAPVRGDGARITLSDGATPINPVTGRRSVDGRVRDTDLQLASNALWAAGAEAIAVNGQRLTATSTIRQAGEAILVDFRPVTTPYVIVAIGPDDLADTFRDGDVGRLFRALVSRFGMSFDAAPVRDVTIPAATEVNLRFAATPAPSSGPPSPSAGSSTGSPAGSSSGGSPSGGSPSTAGAAGPANLLSTPSEGG
jgi:uncharacterized protein YlxW (UPF0749 family)